MKTDYKLGDKVIVQAILKKEKKFNKQTFFTETVFVNNGCENIIGIYIGYRTALTGYTRYDEDGPQFRKTGKVSYALVATHLRKNPIKVDWNFIL